METPASKIPKKLAVGAHMPVVAAPSHPCPED